MIMKQRIFISTILIFFICFSFFQDSNAQTNRIDIEEYMYEYSVFNDRYITSSIWKNNLRKNDIKEKYVYKVWTTDTNVKDSFLLYYYKFDENANILLFNEYKNSGSISNHIENEYDSLGNKIRAIEYRSNKLIDKYLG